MANEFLSIKNIARQALPRLIDNLVMPNLVHQDYSNDFEVGKGATVQIRKPVTFTANEFNETSGVQIQDVKETSVDVTLDKLATVDIEFGAVSRATDVDSLNRLFLEPAAAALAQKINTDGLKLANDVPYVVGTAGTTPQNLSIFAQAAKVLDANKSPTTERYGVWDPSAMEKFRTIGDIVNAEKSGSTAALRAGSIGNIFGINNYMSQAVASNSAATGAGTIVIKKTGGYDEGATTIHLDGVSTAFVAGDTIVIGGKVYTVKSVSAIASTDEQDVTLTTGLVEAVANSASVTAGSAATNNIVFHKNAFAFVTRPLSTPAGVESYVTSYNGLSLRVTRGYNMQYKKEMLSMDILYGYKCINPQMAVKVLG